MDVPQSFARLRQLARYWSNAEVGIHHLPEGCPLTISKAKEIGAELTNLLEALDNADAEASQR